MLLTENERRACLTACTRLLDLWKLTPPQKDLLLNDDDELDWRLSNLLGIHKCLRILFYEKQSTYEWVKKENDEFDGSALDLILNGEIERVRKYLALEVGLYEMTRHAQESGEYDIDN